MTKVNDRNNPKNDRYDKKQGKLKSKNQEEMIISDFVNHVPDTKQISNDDENILSNLANIKLTDDFKPKAS